MTNIPFIHMSLRGALATKQSPQPHVGYLGFASSPWKEHPGLLAKTCAEKSINKTPVLLCSSAPSPAPAVLGRCVVEHLVLNQQSKIYNQQSIKSVYNNLSPIRG